MYCPTSGLAELVSRPARGPSLRKAARGELSSLFSPETLSRMKGEKEEASSPLVGGDSQAPVVAGPEPQHPSVLLLPLGV